MSNGIIPLQAVKEELKFDDESADANNIGSPDAKNCAEDLNANEEAQISSV